MFIITFLPNIYTFSFVCPAFMCCSVCGLVADVKQSKPHSGHLLIPGDARNFPQNKQGKEQKNLNSSNPKVQRRFSKTFDGWNRNYTISSNPASDTWRILSLQLWAQSTVKKCTTKLTVHNSSFGSCYNDDGTSDSRGGALGTYHLTTGTATPSKLKGAPSSDTRSSLWVPHSTARQKSSPQDNVTLSPQRCSLALPPPSSRRWTRKSAALSSRSCLLSRALLHMDQLLDCRIPG